MKISRLSKKLLAMTLAVITIMLVSPLNAFVASAEEENTEESVGHALVIKSESLSVKKRKTVQLTASVSNVETQPEITWSSSNENIATVDANGLVKGVQLGEVIIRAKATVDGETIHGEFPITVVKTGHALKDYLADHQILSYQYSYVDDYYYTNDKEAWQYNFGFGKIYDLVSPFILLEYDYIRVFFTYEDKDWMLQMWKGQYGMIFYGGEIGIYTRPHDEDGINDWVMFDCAAKEDWLQMEMTLWHQDSTGVWLREFSREYDYYWWCTGFKNGHLRQEEPADELRMTGRITFKSEEMAEIVASGLAECGFGQSSSREGMGLDTFYKNGRDVYFCWQNISEAESTMAIKIGTGILSTIAITTLFPFALPFILPVVVPAAGAFTLLVLLVSAIL